MKFLRHFLGKFIVVYLDDILIYSQDLAQHIQYLKSLFTILRAQRLYGKLEKCSFLMQEISFLGFIINKDGIKVDPNKIEAIISWPTSKSICNNPTYR